MASGMIGLITELGRRNYGPDCYFDWYDVESVAEMVCVKGEDAPVRKDNTWGWGMPSLSPLARGAMRPTAPTTDITSTAMLMMCMIPIMMISGV
jgi:serine protease AprX